MALPKTIVNLLLGEGDKFWLIFRYVQTIRQTKLKIRLIIQRTQW